MMKRTLLLAVLLGVPAFAQTTTVTITVQDKIYPKITQQNCVAYDCGASGMVPSVDRISDPVGFNVYLQDVAGGITTTNLRVTGAGVINWQARVTQVWPSGRPREIYVDTQANTSASNCPAGVSGTCATLTVDDLASQSNVVCDSGAVYASYCQPGSTNIATDGTTISINTGAMTATVKKANFNLFDSVSVGGTAVIAANSPGLVLKGPAADGTSTLCGTCTTSYQSSSDASSTAVILENGPAKARIRGYGDLKSGTEAYMHQTVDEDFFYNRAWVSTTIEQRNADIAGGSPSALQSATKGFQSFEIVLNLSTAANRMTIGDDTNTSQTVTFTGAAQALFYNAYSYKLQDDDDTNTAWDRDYQVVSYITRNGYLGSPSDATHPVYEQTGWWFGLAGGSKVAGSNTKFDYPAGRADFYDNTTGRGVQVVINQMPREWPKAMYLDTDGTVHVSIWPDQNLFSSTTYSCAGVTSPCISPYYLRYPSYYIHEVYFDFHSAALSSQANDFLRMQHNLIGRQDITTLNASGALPMPIPTAAGELAYNNAQIAKANAVAGANQPTLSLPPSPCLVPKRYRWHFWNAGGGLNQHETAWSAMRNWFQYGCAGSYAYAEAFYTFLAEQVAPRADGGTPNRTCVEGASITGCDRWYNHAGSRLTNWATYDSSSANSDKAHLASYDPEHFRVWGIWEFAAISDSEVIKDAALDGFANRALCSACVEVASLSLINAREVGHWLINEARAYTFMQGIGLSSQLTTIENNVNTVLNGEVWPTFQSARGCYPTKPGCSTPTTNVRGHADDNGVLFPYAGSSGSVNYPNPPADYGPGGAGSARAIDGFQSAIELQGLWEWASLKGKSWTHWQDFLDISYGVYQWAKNVMWIPPSSGLTYGMASADCPMQPGTSFCGNPTISTVWYYEPFDYAGNTDFPSGTGVWHPAPSNSNDRAPIWVNWYWATGDVTNLLPDWEAYYQSIVLYSGYDRSFYSEQTMICVLSPSACPGWTSPVQSYQGSPLSLAVTDHANGTYTLGYTPPVNCGDIQLRLNTTKTMQEWLGLNGTTATYTHAPASNQPWYSATRSGTAPPCGSSSVVVTTGTTGMTAANFMAKADIALTPPNPDLCTVTPPASPLTGSITVTGTCSPGQGSCNRWQAKLGGVNFGAAQTGPGPYSVTANTNALSWLDGIYAWNCAVTDDAGGSGSGTGSSSTVKNAVGLRGAAKGKGSR